MSENDERNDWSGIPDEPPEFQPIACLVALGLSLAFWAIAIGVVTWLLIR